jgi:hypothetical protein
VYGEIFKGPYCNHYDIELLSEEKEFFEKFYLHELYENEFDVIIFTNLNGNNLYAFKNSQNLYKVTSYLSICIETLMHVSQINHHPQENISTNEYLINTSNFHTQFSKQIIANLIIKM